MNTFGWLRHYTALNVCVASCKMAAFLLAIVRGVHHHCTRPHDTREALPADHSSGQSAFSCHPHASCSGPWRFAHHESKWTVWYEM